MNIRRSFFICLPLGFVLAAAVYFGLFFLQLGVPTSHSVWLNVIIEKKGAAAAAIAKPKLLVVAGSSAFYGISAAEIERQTGFPAYNFGTNAALGCEYLLHRARKVSRPGDVVLLAFEYETYLIGGVPVRRLTSFSSATCSDTTPSMSGRSGSGTASGSRS